MKTERRHELQHNDLVALAGKYAGDVKPHAKKIVGIAIVTAVALLAMMLMKTRGRAAAERGWTSYFAAVGQSDLDGLYDVAKKYPRSAAGAWAMQSAGDINLATGSVNMYSDREEAVDRFQKAQENYSTAKQRASNDLLKQRSQMGLAQTHEALNEFEEAETIYHQVIRNWPDSTIAKLASERLSILQHPETKEFYDWFMAQKVEPPVNPLGDVQIKTPSIYDDLPGDQDLTVPNADALLEGRGAIQPPEEAVEDTPVPEMPIESEITPGRGGDFDENAESVSDAGTPLDTESLGDSTPEANASEKPAAEVNSSEETPSEEAAAPAGSE